MEGAGGEAEEATERQEATACLFWPGPPVWLTSYPEGSAADGEGKSQPSREESGGGRSHSPRWGRTEAVKRGKLSERRQGTFPGMGDPGRAARLGES